MKVKIDHYSFRCPTKTYILQINDEFELIQEIARLASANITDITYHDEPNRIDCNKQSFYIDIIKPFQLSKTKFW